MNAAIIITDRWAVISADIDRVVVAARKFYGRPSLVACARCGDATLNLATCDEGRICVPCENAQFEANEMNS